MEFGGETPTAGRGRSPRWVLQEHTPARGHDHQGGLSFSTTQETPRAPSPPKAGSGLSLTPLPESQSLPGGSTFSWGPGGGEVQGPASRGAIAEVTGDGGLSGPQGVSSEHYFNPGALLPPRPMAGAVPLYNPAQVPQVRKPQRTGVSPGFGQRRCGFTVLVSHVLCLSF